ncbi:MAG: hypothetical protein DHS20C01_22190 [marine bacterium B5-7]|nr:MAG: hypothetical protein DHS20C01_22190 [marine bacterium B5-7]
MPVYFKHKLVHIHIPKTAGTAIERFFHRIGDMEWGTKSWLGQKRHDERWYEYQHFSLEELWHFAGTRFPGFTSFAVVRDPLTRLISDFIWRSWIQEAHPNSPTQFFDSFDEFLDAIPDDINSGWSKHIQGTDQKWANFLIHVRPQHHFVLDDSGNCLVDVILRYEVLPQDFALFLEPFGLRADNIKTPPIRDPDEYFTREQIERIKTIYAGDFALTSLPKNATVPMMYEGGNAS